MKRVTNIKAGEMTLTAKQEKNKLFSLDLQVIEHSHPGGTQNAGIEGDPVSGTLAGSPSATVSGCGTCRFQAVSGDGKRSVEVPDFRG